MKLCKGMGVKTVAGFTKADDQDIAWRPLLAQAKLGKRYDPNHVLHKKE